MRTCGVILFQLLCLAPAHSGQGVSPAVIPPVNLIEVVRDGSHAVIDEGSPGTEDNKYGFESGRAIKLNGPYHLITAERFGDPNIVKMRLAHWESHDGDDWRRVATLDELSGEFEGKDPRAALWGLMPIFDPSAERWHLVYVAYCAKPNDSSGWYLNYAGKIWLAKSRASGKAGVGGPNEDIGIIPQPRADSDAWEGLRGTDSFFPCNVGESWYSFYGSAQTQAKPNEAYPIWSVGLAKPDRLEGPWKRLSRRNPVKLHFSFAGNPVVTKLADGRYVAMLDGGPRAKGPKYSFSEDGLRWSQATCIDLEKHCMWWSAMRTPLGLPPEEDDSFTVFHTAYTKSGFAKLGVFKLRIRDASP